jgi:hypothetical protein
MTLEEVVSFLFPPSFFFFCKLKAPAAAAPSSWEK